MKKIALILFVFSVIFYALFLAVLFDAPVQIMIPSAILSALLAIANVTVAYISWNSVDPKKKLPVWLFTAMIVINAPILLFLVLVVLLILSFSGGFKIG